MYTIKDNISNQSNQTQMQQMHKTRKVMRIMEWRVQSVVTVADTSEAELAERSINDVKLSMETTASVEAKTKQQQQDEANGIDRTPSFAGRRDEIAEEETAAKEAANKYKACAPPRRVLVKVLVVVMDQEKYNFAISSESFAGRREELNIRSERDFDQKKAFAGQFQESYFISFNTNEFIDFNLDPEKIGLEITIGVDASLANPKLVAYAEDARYGVPGVSTQPPELRTTQEAVNAFGESLSERVDKVKEALRIGKTKAEKEAELLINNKAKRIDCGTSYIEVKSKDPTREKGTVTPGQDGVKMGGVMAGINASKAYENFSKKIQYATTPFAMDYKGWKPNILGKFFASDSTVGVKTWKQSISPYGEELIKVASSIAALKIFQVAIKETGIKDRLNEATERLKDKQKVDRSSQDSTIIANEGYNASISWNTAVNDISRFARK